MRNLLALTIAVAACAAPPKKVDTTSESHDVPATCCCKSFPTTSEDGRAVYVMENRMECSTHQGECVPDVQCNGSTRPAPAGGQAKGGDGVPPPPPLPPSVN